MIAKFAAAAFLAALASSASAGETYATLGLGQSQFIGNGLWHNFPPIHEAYDFEWTANEQSNTWSVGLGRTLSWGAVELTYHNFGDTKSYAGYPWDPDSPSLPPGCVYPCTPTQWVYHRGTAKGVSLTALPELKFWSRNAVFARLGATLYRATFEYKIANERGDPFARTFDGSNGWSYTGVSPAYGAGVRLGNFTFEFTRHAWIEAKNKENSTGSFRGIDTVSIGYRVMF